MSWHFTFLNPHEQDEYECTECGTSMPKDTGVCSGTCHEASMI
jgi:predicted nucleic acid-binding Zn ribbon protein